MEALGEARMEADKAFLRHSVFFTSSLHHFTGRNSTLCTLFFRTVGVSGRHLLLLKMDCNNMAARCARECLQRLFLWEMVQDVGILVSPH